MIEATQTSLFLLIQFVSNTIQTITGFAGTMLAMPLSIILVGAENARVVLNLISLLSAIVLTCMSYRHIQTREMLKMLLFMLIGMVFGVLCLKKFSIEFLLPLYGVFIIFVALKSLCGTSKLCFSNKFAIPILLLSGFIHGLFLSGGALLVVYATSVSKTKEALRANLQPIWVILSIILLIGDILNGAINNTSLSLFSQSILPLGGSFIIGGFLFKHVNQAVYFKLASILLIISGITAIL